ncbi:TMEM175 family protein [Bremerella cremea]|uniref:TMEM175 family protein n=1 Tax=Bremerella cremea TaxID=1031537 RepID=UPI0031E9291E
MGKGRLEAFSDGVIAILITIMVFNLKAPQMHTWDGLMAMMPGTLTYVLSFVYLAIYWNNHHHLLQLTQRVNGGVLWANLHLLFWLSLIPVATAWMHESEFVDLPVAIYGVVLFCCSVAWWILQSTLVAQDGAQSRLREAVGIDIKGKASMMAYLFGTLVAFASPWFAIAVYSVLAVVWLVPDQRFERAVVEAQRAEVAQQQGNVGQRSSEEL